jgi:predicted nucleic-acid-binding protein
MLGLDTNVVMRLLVSDDAEQTRRARKLIEQSLAREEPVLVSLLVLIESEWVLRSSYGFKRDAVLSMFRALLEARELSFEDEPARRGGSVLLEGQRLRFRRLFDHCA